MKEPIFIFEDGAYDGCYANLQDALRSIEATDAINNILSVYDSEGQLLKLSAKDEFDTVTISSMENTSLHQQDFKEKLIVILKYYHEIGKLKTIDWLEETSLDNLVNEITKLGYEK